MEFFLSGGKIPPSPLFQRGAQPFPRLQRGALASLPLQRGGQSSTYLQREGVTIPPFVKGGKGGFFRPKSLLPVVQARGRSGYRTWRFPTFVLILCILFSLALAGYGWALEADDIIKRVEDNLNGETAFMKITMKVKTARSERTLKMESWSIGKEKSFIKINYPLKDKGITFLKIENVMWQFVPRIEKIIKIPSSLMMQSWMGSDFTHDDLIKESSISDDYHKKILVENESGYEIELLPLEDAPVVWGRIVMTISKEHFLPVKVRYFDEDGAEVRVLHYLDVKHFGERVYPSRWLMQPLDEHKAGHQTIVEISDALFDREISESYFTKRALKKYSM